ncbi:MAG: type II toxin-antitoxin system VapC family toxin [Myxococcaceae bacterium]
MIYWDTSAFAAGLIGEDNSSLVFSFLKQHANLKSYTSLFTFLEIESAFQRRLNDKSLSLDSVRIARVAVSRFRQNVRVIPADESLLDIALHYQKIYGLRAGDALQLASARVGMETPSRVQFMCLDKLLNQAAAGEGFKLCVQI